MAKAFIKNSASNKLVFIKSKNKFNLSILDNQYLSKISYTPSFRVKFINVGVPGYGPSNPAPIGIAIIGVNNYIL